MLNGMLYYVFSNIGGNAMLSVTTELHVTAWAALAGVFMCPLYDHENEVVPYKPN